MIVDLDSHLREEYFLDEVYKLEGRFASKTPVRIGDGKYQQARFSYDWPTGEPVRTAVTKGFHHPQIYDPKYAWRGGAVAERQVGGYDMERRVNDLKQEGIDHQMLFPTRIYNCATADGELGAVLCQAYNNWVKKLTRGHEEQLWPVAMMPAGCPEAMPGELRRCVKELHMKAAHLVSYCGSRNLDDPSFAPFFEAAQELDVPLFCHPNTLGELINRFDNFFPQHVLGRPLNCTAALVALVCGGVFERYPRLKVAFFECSAEWIRYWMHRMDEDFEWAKDEYARELTMLPSDYVKRNCYVTCEADEKYLAPALEELGDDHVCMATDYPHFDSEFPETVAGIRQRTDITPRQKELILGENAARLLNL